MIRNLSLFYTAGMFAQRAVTKLDSPAALQPGKIFYLFLQNVYACLSIYPEPVASV